MPGCQPQYALDCTCFFTLYRFTKGGWLFRFLPSAATIAGAEHRRTQVTGLGRHQRYLGLAWIADDVVNDVPEIQWALQRPALSRDITDKLKRAFASGDPECCHGRTLCLDV